MDDAAMYWELFMKTGAPEAYLAFRAENRKGTSKTICT